jgi:choline dehydrogenase-like flavoprotein
VLTNVCNGVIRETSTRRRTVIIGGGTVGLYAGSELAKRGEEVLVIEAGGSDLGSFAPQTYSSIGRLHQGIRIARSRCLGGTSNLWGGQLVEFQPVDFGGRKWVPDSEWPVSYDEIAPYYKRTYENLGISEEFAEDKLVFANVRSSKQEFEQGFELFLTRWMKVPSFAIAFRNEMQTRSNFSVLLDHTVIGFAGAEGAISSVQTIDRRGGKHRFMGDRFILAAGTIEISRLMLHAAASRDWDCPWRDNNNLGAYFQDHLAGRVGSLEIMERSRFFDTFSTLIWAGQKFQPKLRLDNRTLQSTRILNVQGMMSFESSVSENLIYLKQFIKAAIYSRKCSGIGDLFRNLRACGKYLLPLMWRYVIDNRVFVPDTSKISLNVQCEQAPLRSSRIYIDSSVKDEFGMPKVILDWRIGTEEFESIREFTVRCERALRVAGLARLKIAKALVNMDRDFLATLHDNSHQAGGARIGHSEEDGVVNHNLRVFGTTNLYVAGAASFRTSSNANITFTALAFVTRLVDHLTRT